VRTLKKPAWDSAPQVRCTCSMHGLKEQNTPSGRRHLAADSTACSRRELEVARLYVEAGGEWWTR